VSGKVGADDALAAGVDVEGLPRAEAPAPHCTDLGNSERFVRQHGADVRYCWLWKSWLQWTGIRWERDPGDGVRERAKTTARRLYKEAARLEDTQERKTLAAWATRTEQEKLQRAMLSLARSAVPVLPAQLDADPWLFNVPNGTLDLRTGELREHRRSDFITRLCPTRYDRATACPAFEAFLRKIFANDVPLLAWLQRLLGSGLVGQAPDQILTILWGAGANGKSTLVQTVTRVLGEDYAVEAPVSTFVAKRDGVPNDIARLAGARLVVASESDDGRRLNEALVKQLTGGDKITARFLHQEFFSFTPTFTTILTTNHKPEIRGTDHAIWRRVRLVPFTHTIAEADRDEHFLERVLLLEAPGILAWLAAGCRAWQRDGLKAVPEAVTAATEVYRIESDILADFLDEKATLGSDLFASTASLYDAYLEFCTKTNDKHPISKDEFGKRLHAKGFQKDKVAGLRGWRGLALL
jgi:putative DNA primase/helicase